MKIVKYIFLSFWTLWCIIGIANNRTHYRGADWIFIITFAVMPYLILWYLAHRKANKGKKAHQNIIEETTVIENATGNILSNPTPQPINQTTTQPISKQANAQSESEAKKLAVTQNMMDESLSKLNKAVSSGNILNVTVHQSDSPSATPVPEVSYIENDKMIVRTDGKEIADNEVPYLVQVGHEKAVLAAGKSSSSKHQRTDREEELCVQFMMNHEDEIQKHTASFEEAYRIAYSEKNLNTKIELLQKVIDLYEKEKKWFYKTKGGMIYFEDYYEHMYNSRNEYFSYIDSVNDYLEYNTHKRDYVIPEIINLITSQDGIIQKDIYEYLPDESKSEIQKIIRELEDDKIIKRAKKGNSYFLTLY